MSFLHCSKCDGRVFIDRAYSNQGNLELFCIRCGKRWELHKDHPAAVIINRLEKKREFNHFGDNIPALVLS